jgi:hypothetical protein
VGKRRRTRTLHLVRLAVVGQIARQHQHVRIVAHALKLILQLGVTLWTEVQIGRSCNSHSLTLRALTLRARTSSEFSFARQAALSSRS